MITYRWMLKWGCPCSSQFLAGRHLGNRSLWLEERPPGVCQWTLGMRRGSRRRSSWWCGTQRDLPEGSGALGTQSRWNTDRWPPRYGSWWPRAACTWGLGNGDDARTWWTLRRWRRPSGYASSGQKVVRECLAPSRGSGRVPFEVFPQGLLCPSRIPETRGGRMTSAPPNGDLGRIRYLEHNKDTAWVKLAMNVIMLIMFCKAAECGLAAITATSHERHGVSNHQ